MNNNLADKNKAKQLVQKIIATKITYAVFTTEIQVESFPWETLPPSFVVTPAHIPNTKIEKSDKDRFNVLNATAQIKKWLNTPSKYPGITPSVIIERNLGSNIKNYRLWYVQNKLQAIESDGMYFDANWKQMPLNGLKTANIDKPVNSNEIIDKANRLNTFIGNNDFVIIDICNRTTKTCCKTINDLFFNEFIFDTENIDNPFKTKA